MQKHGVPVTLLPVTHYTGRALPHYTIQGFIRTLNLSAAFSIWQSWHWQKPLFKSHKNSPKLLHNTCQILQTLLTLNTSYKKKYVGQVEVKRNFLNKKEAELKYIKLIEHCHTRAVILMRFFLSFVNRMVIKGAYWYQIKIHCFEHTLPNETLKQLPFLRSGLLWSSLWSGRDHLWDNTLHRKTTVGFELPVGDLSVTYTNNLGPLSHKIPKDINIEIHGNITKLSD